jgi:hypothetical protein
MGKSNGNLFQAVSQARIMAGASKNRKQLSQSRSRFPSLS